jgi:hypothetical protein
VTGGLFALAEGLLLPTSQSLFGYRTAVTALLQLHLHLHLRLLLPLAAEFNPT